MTRRYIVLGAGAIGGALGGMLQAAGESVVFIARGAHLEALQRIGLEVALPSRSIRLQVQAIGRPQALSFDAGDVVLLCTKSQDTAAAIAALAQTAPRDLPVVCAQNGIDNEACVAAQFPHTLSMVVFSPCQYLEPGRVSIHSEPVFGGLDIGCYPSGTDAVSDDLARATTRAGFDGRNEPRIGRVRYAKLLSNLGNIVQALLGRDASPQALLQTLQLEAEACFRAAHIEFEALGDLKARNHAVLELPVNGALRGGGSTWQSLARGTALETDYLNGAVVRLGKDHGVATPANAVLVDLARRAGAEHWPPGHVTLAEVEAAIARASN
jgi:2-dehydropantoate 2-reductase